ncbi:hypothetical protein [Altererythrobacter sp. Root672]|uniref:hypothetical protein n=1 Tax=Altererythrobacter sp. Root672 TaxID=1736584 RepID=UPI0006FF0D3F|nr:hypothetical protein [Altererythrobacter sp. Root672]KRA84503.1 hypothetical protein ASD76_11160 [Altererythrobacter sp. Root672]
MAEPANAATTPAGKQDEKPAPRRVDADRVPGLDLTADPRWALAFLAKLYAKAKERKVLNTLSGWIEPDSRSLRTVFNPARNSSALHRTTRDMIVGEVVSDLIASGQLPSTTSKNEKDLRALFERETVIGVSLLERTAVNWMSAKLTAHRQKVLRILIDATQMPAMLSQAAAIVVKTVDATKASVRDDDLYRVLYPKNRRAWRDGSTMDRVNHVRYISAVRQCIQEAREQTIVLQESPADPGTEIRGLARAPPKPVFAQPRTSTQSAPRKSIVDALQLLELMIWHPKAVMLVRAWNKGPAAGTQFLAEVINESLTAIDSLASKINEDPSTVWRFPGALRSCIEALNILERDTLTQYALVWASAVKPALDTALDVIGNVVSLLEMYGGPIALVAAVADAILQAAGAAVSVLRQLDQDHAESASLFEKETDRLSTGGKYIGAIGQGATALLAATAIPGALRKLADTAGKGRAAAANVPAATRGIEPGTSLAGRNQRATPVTRVERPPSGTIPPQNSIQKPGGASDPTIWAAGRRPGSAGKKGPNRLRDEESTGGIEFSEEARAIDEAQGMRRVDRPPVSREPPSGSAAGDAGEGRDWIASGLINQPRKYPELIRDNTAEKMSRELMADLQANYLSRKNLRRNKKTVTPTDDALRKYVDRFAQATPTPIEEIRDVPFLVWMPDNTVLKRKFDRVVRERNGRILLRETKAYTKGALDYTSKDLRRQLDIDLEILDQYKYARVEYRLDGNVLDTSMRELEALERRYLGRFIIDTTPNFKEVTAAQMRRASSP